MSVKIFCDMCGIYHTDTCPEELELLRAVLEGYPKALPQGFCKESIKNMTKKYRKKPIVIYATQITEPMDISTLEGIMHGNPGDWLITGVNGEQYFCKPDIFEKTYEAVEESCGGGRGIVEW